LAISFVIQKDASNTSALAGGHTRRFHNMKLNIKRFLGISIILPLFIASCNLPGNGETPPEISTAAALTVQAAINESANQTPLASPVATSAVGTTPTFSQARASVGEVTNCRTGPGTNYERVTQLVANESVEIIGFFPPNYWIVSTSAGECWLSGEFATPSGSFSTVPTVTAPPTSEGGELEAATFPNNGWTFFCYGPGQADIALTWNDKADNETGYRILRDTEVISELPANSTNFAETIELDSGESVNYQIQVYNANGEVNTGVDITCP
jgi:hypothetical protein